jgi:hypothetical protein
MYSAAYAKNSELLYREFICTPSYHLCNDYLDESLIISSWASVQDIGFLERWHTQAEMVLPGIEWDLDDLPALHEKIKIYVIFS